MNAVINIEELGFKIERMILAGAKTGKPPKLSELFIVIGNNDEASFEKDLGERFISELHLHLAEKDPELALYVMDTKKIKVFFSKKCAAFKNGEYCYKKYILDSRKYNYPNISTPKSMLN